MAAIKILGLFTPLGGTQLWGPFYNRRIFIVDFLLSHTTVLLVMSQYFITLLQP